MLQQTWDNIIMAIAKDISSNIAYMAALARKFWKLMWKDSNYMGFKESSS